MADFLTALKQELKAVAYTYRVAVLKSTEEVLVHDMKVVLLGDKMDDIMRRALRAGAKMDDLNKIQIEAEQRADALFGDEQEEAKPETKYITQRPFSKLQIHKTL